MQPSSLSLSFPSLSLSLRKSLSLSVSFSVFFSISEVGAEAGQWHWTSQPGRLCSYTTSMEGVPYVRTAASKQYFMQPSRPCCEACNTGRRFKYYLLAAVAFATVRGAAANDSDWCPLPGCSCVLPHA